MTLIVETGVGITNANSYVSLASALTYAQDHGFSDWVSSSDPVRETALIKATAYIDANYQFNGVINSTEQALAWPRSGAFDNEGRNLSSQVPKLVVAACCELARVALSGDLIASLQTPAVKRKHVKAGSVETDTEYAVSGGANTDASPCPIADKLLSQLLAVSKSNISGGFAAFERG